MRPYFRDKDGGNNSLGQKIAGGLVALKKMGPLFSLEIGGMTPQKEPS